MSDWLHELPVAWMAVIVFGGTFLVTGAIYATVMRLAMDGRGRSFKAVSPGLLPPLGIIFGLFVAFTAAQVWNDNERAQSAVNREASALRSVLVMSAIFSADIQARFRASIRDHIEETVTKEWPMLAQRNASLRFTPPHLAQALQLILTLTPETEGQKTAQREIATAIETALDARRQRILISQSQVNLVKWACLLLQAVAALIAIAMVHSDNGVAAAITMTLFAIGVAASVLLILSHDRPFTGEVALTPAPLLEVMPDLSSSTNIEVRPSTR
jgi:hypothetical protein